MITMRSDWWNADSYYPWIDPLFRRRSGRKSTSTGIYTCSRSATRPTTLLRPCCAPVTDTGVP